MSVIETTKTQVTAIPHVVDELCHACRECLARAVCRSKAIVQLDPDEPHFIDASRCYGCHLCITTCLHACPACPERSRGEPGRREAIVLDGHRI